MRTPGRWLDVAIVVALLVTAVRVWGAAPLTDWWNPRAPLFQPSQELSFAGFQPARSARTVLMFVDASCPGCQQSSAFYKRLVELERNTDSAFRLVVAAPRLGIDATTKWLGAIGVDSTSALPVDKPWLRGFTVTPTLIVTDQGGTITDIVMGKLEPAQEEQFISRLEGHSTTAMNNSPTEVPKGSCSRLADDDRSIQMIDLRNRNEFSSDSARGAKNIPFEEISLRAVAELETTRRVMVVESSNADERTYGGVQLRALGFPDVVLCVP